MKKRRIPRTMGVTTLLQKGHREAAIKLILREYANNNFTISGYHYTIPELCKMLSKDSAWIIGELTKPMKAFLKQNGAEGAYQAFLGHLIQTGLSDRQLFLAQNQTLMHAQGGKYKPFISSTVVANFRNLNDWMAQMIKIGTLLKPANAPSQSLPEHISGKYLGINEAVKLIDAERSTQLLTDGNNILKDSVLNDGALNDLPEVIATKQQGITFDGNTEKRKRIHAPKDKPSSYSDAIIIP